MRISKLVLIYILIFLLISLTVYPFQSGKKYEAILVEVVDGDTLRVKIDGKVKRVRLIGIDAPECRKNKKAYRDAKYKNTDINKIIKMGQISTLFMKNLVKPGEKLFIEFDLQERDRYGRLLGYVFLQDGRMINEIMLKDGYAYIMTIPPNVKYVDRFYRAFITARKLKKGLWGKGFNF